MPDNSSERRILLEGREIVYTLERKRVKNINLRIRPDGSVYVSAPPRAALARIEGFLRQQGPRILAALDRAAEAKERRPEPRYEDGAMVPVWGRQVPLRLSRGNFSAGFDGEALCITLRDPEDPELCRRAVEAWEKQSCEAVLPGLCRKYYPAFRARGVDFPSLRFRRMRSRWGVCRPQRGEICFSTRLAEAPVECAEYVAVHELAHFLQPNHSPAFYAEVERVLPDWKARRALLRQWE